MGSFKPHPFGKYYLIEKISSGGMGEIFRAKTFGIDGFEKQFAIKCILPQYSENKELTKMLIHEAKLSVLLTHTNIVQIYDFGKVDEDYFISMEYLNGVDLKHFIQVFAENQQAIPENIAIYIVSEVCRGLEYAHFKKDKDGNPLGIIHRDISPPNILITFEGEVKIVDFGIAKVEQNTQHTQTGLIKGKVPYMSPEQARGEKLDHRSDVFAAGLVLFEMLTGEKLFSGDDYIQVLLKVRGNPVTEKMLSDSIEDVLKKILLKSLAYEPKHRYSSAGKFQIDLSHYLHSKYPDFTPNALTELMQKLFSKKIEERAQVEKTEIPLDKNTYSNLMKANQHEYLVQKEDSKKISNLLQNMESTAEFPSPEDKKKRFHHLMDFTLAGLLLMGVVFSIFYRIYIYKPQKPETLQPIASVNRPSPVAPTFGNLQIYTFPPGAKIFINGHDSTRVSPTVMTDLKIGETYILNFTLPNFRDIIRSIQIKDSQPLLISETFSLLPPAVNSSTPKKIIYVHKKQTSSNATQANPASSENLNNTKVKDDGKNNDNATVKGFKKAGSAIKNFFTGKKNNETPTQTNTTSKP